MFYDQDFEGLAGIRSDLDSLSPDGAVERERDWFLWTGELEDYFGAGWLRLALDCLNYEEE